MLENIDPIWSCILVIFENIDPILDKNTERIRKKNIDSTRREKRIKAKGGGVLTPAARARRLSLAQRELALSLAQREICAATRPGNT